MRVLHVSDVYLPRLGGLELQVSDLAARQRLEGDEVVVATATPGAAAQDVVRLARPGRRSADLARLLAQHEPDVVHAHSSLVSPLAWTATRVAARAGVPAVVTMHSLWPRGGSGRALGALLRGVPVGTTWTAVSSAAADLLAPAVPGHTVGVLPNGIDSGGWVPRGPEAASRTPVIVSVMRTAPRKRPLALLRVLEAVRSQVPARQQLQAFLVGAGPLDGAIRRRVAGSGLARWVTVTGRLDRSDIRQLLGRADLYLAPARQESFGIAALEARYAGLPVVGMTGTGLSDFIRHGVDGYLVGSDEEMASQAAELVRSSAALAAAQGRARSPVPGFDWPAVLQRHRAVYAAAGPARSPVTAGVPWRSADEA